MTRRTILMYHRVADDASDPYGLCVAPDRFMSQLDVLTELADVVSLDELVALGRRSPRPRLPRSRPQVAITFDDGYADNLEHGLPALEVHAAPATVFVVSGTLGDSRGFWWHRLAQLLEGRTALELTLAVGPSELRISLEGPRAATDALVAAHSRLRLVDIEVIDAALGAIADQLAVPMPEPFAARTLRHEELEKLACSPLVTVGAHTDDHRLLAGLPRTAQESRMRRSARVLEDVVGGPVRHFAYPYGDARAFDDDSVAAARRCGFATACTTFAGGVTRFDDPLQLPRRMVRDWDATTFAARLKAWGAV